jgi:hypothetical protein
MPEWLPKRQILHRSIVQYEITHTKKKEREREREREVFRNHLAFLDSVKASDKVRRDKLFEILQSKNIPNLLLKRIIEI